MRGTMSENIALGAAILLGIFTLTAIFRKLREYSTAARTSRSFVPAIGEAFGEGGESDTITTAVEVSEKHRKSHVARVVASGLVEFQSEQRARSPADVIIRRAERAMNRCTEIVEAEFKYGTGIMKVTAGVAPLLAAYHSTRAALAIGVVVAAPAIWMSIYAENKIEAFGVEMKNSSSELLDYLEKRLDVQVGRARETGGRTRAGRIK